VKLTEFETISDNRANVSYAEALKEAVKVAALCEITNCGSFDTNTARTMLSISYPGRSYNDIQGDWKKAYRETLKKETFKMNLKLGKQDD